MGQHVFCHWRGTLEARSRRKEVSMVGQIMAPSRWPHPHPRILYGCHLRGQRGLSRRNSMKALEVGRLSWFIGVGLVELQAFLWEGGRRVRVRKTRLEDVILLALKIEEGARSQGTADSF